jgi:predicted AAA+ superfamily ATPase
MPAELAVAQADPSRLLDGERPILIDEWQRLPAIWDLVRRADDDGAPPGSFLLTGSAAPDPPPTHSGAGRIVSLRMRPMSFSERVPGHTVSLAELLTGSRPSISGTSTITLAEYTEEILASGLPGIRRLTGRARRLQLDGYLLRIVDREIPDEAGVAIRSPATLRRWLAAYAAATATTTSFEKIRDAASPGQDHKPAKDTVQSYREALSRLWLLDEIDAWVPANNPLNELGLAPKHQLADSALATRLLGVDAPTLSSGGQLGPAGTLLGALFESLVALSVKAYAALSDAVVGHMRTARGRQEIRSDRRT